ncbi:MAG: hypothetical protein AAF797_08740 [Planctomycetota bacterium]
MLGLAWCWGVVGCTVPVGVDRLERGVEAGSGVALADRVWERVDWRGLPPDALWVQLEPVEVEWVLAEGDAEDDAVGAVGVSRLEVSRLERRLRGVVAERLEGVGLRVIRGLDEVVDRSASVDGSGVGVVHAGVAGDAGVGGDLMGALGAPAEAPGLGHAGAAGGVGGVGGPVRPDALVRVRAVVGLDGRGRAVLLPGTEVVLRRVRTTLGEEGVRGWEPGREAGRLELSRGVRSERGVAEREAVLDGIEPVERWRVDGQRWSDAVERVVSAGLGLGTLRLWR